jgi:hypothetical protein
MATALAMAALSVVAIAAAGGQTFGDGVRLTETTTISALYAQPEKFVGKAIRIDGVVTSVCEEMGCWMALAEKGKPDQTVRFKVEDGKVVFPISARGKNASAEGVFQRIEKADKEANEAAREQTAKDTKAPAFSQTYQVKATGAVVR